MTLAPPGAGRRSNVARAQGVRIVTVRMRSSYGYFASRNVFVAPYSRVALAFAIGCSP